MSSKSKLIQDQLERLEQLSAPFKEQLTESARLVGVKITKDGKIAEDTEEEKRFLIVLPFKREEWLLIWLVKKLKGDKTARKIPSSWWLLNYLVRAIPTRSATRILLTKEVFVEERDKPSKQLKTSILQKTLEEVLSVTPVCCSPETIDHENSKNRSRKRNRNGDLLDTDVAVNCLPDLMEAISTALSFVVEMGSVIASDYVHDLGASFSAAYMKTTYVTSDEKAAIILGTWITLCDRSFLVHNKRCTSTKTNLLTPFIEIWNARLQDDNSPLAFSKYCAIPTLSLLDKTKEDNRQYEWKSQLEILLARNIAIPARKAYNQDSSPTFLKSLITQIIASHVFNAPVLLEIFVRSCQSQDTKYRLPEDEAWLCTVFKALLYSQPDLQNEDCICAMLDVLIDYKVKLDLELLRSIIMKVALSQFSVQWRLVATLIKFDANVFLIPNENDLLEVLFNKITEASLDSSWASISDYVVSKILLPVMTEFTRARDLSKFIKLWHNQISKFENRRENSKLFPIVIQSAWENDALHSKLRELLEPSLTIPQISHIIDWVSESIDESPHAACIILEAILGCFSGQEDIVDSISLRPYHILFDEKCFMGLKIRYRWRAWRLLTATLNWANIEDLNKLTKLWETKFNPFNYYLDNIDSLLVAKSEEYGVLSESIEVFRSVCAAYSASITGSQMEKFVRPIVLRYLQLVFKDVLKNPGDFRLETSMNKSISKPMCRLLRCTFVEFPKTLTLAIELEDKFNQMLQIIFDLASESFDRSSNISEDPQLNKDAYPTLWTSALQSDEVLNNQKLRDAMIGTMLKSITFEKHLNEDSILNNQFAIMIFNHMPLDVISRNNREKIMRAWLYPVNKEKSSLEKYNCSCAFLDPAILALKRRILKSYPNLYEGLEFKSIVAMVDVLSGAKMSQKDIRLALLKDLTHLLISHAQINLDQERRKNYIIEAFKFIKNRIENTEEMKQNRKNFEFIAVFEAALVEFYKKKESLQEMGVIKKADLENTINIFKDYLLARFKKIMTNLHKKLKREGGISRKKEIRILIIIDALTSLGLSVPQISHLGLESQRLAGMPINIARYITTFVTIYGSKSEIIDLNLMWGLDITSYTNRKLIQQTIEGVVNRIDNAKKLQILRSLLDKDCDCQLTPDKLLALRYIIISVEDIKPKRILSQNILDDEDNFSDDSRVDDFDLTLVYILLSLELRKTSEILSFCIISETLDLMLRTKTRSISQYAVDNTLGTICILCSPKSPNLPATRPGTIFLHLTHLLRSILVYHRLKLKGYFPLVQLSMQGLLRCLFQSNPKSFNYHNTTPTSVTMTNKNAEAEFDTAPIWLANINHQLNAKNAESYTRLLTLISDPSESSVQGKRYHSNNYLTSATEKWKHRTILFMRFVLMSYIRWQLEFPMLPAIKERLMPGWFALLNNTTPDTRRLIGAELLNASGRAIFTNLYREYQKFGKWNGS
ncbi:putative urb2 npa2 family protein [Erysiphe neolycopersici]|uniref:Putative urb2 npa2 family protein n=1 Tax=Erysiphe neolycopersici TaxID=212602 RepID=A0A420HUA8_9PEZI|nr:putative urb2 npa2 family protein [Erysiphe neolycopersici]